MAPVGPKLEPLRSSLQKTRLEFPFLGPFLGFIPLLFAIEVNYLTLPRKPALLHASGRLLGAIART